TTLGQFAERAQAPLLPQDTWRSLAGSQSMATATSLHEIRQRQQSRAKQAGAPALDPWPSFPERPRARLSHLWSERDKLAQLHPLPLHANGLQPGSREILRCAPLCLANGPENSHTVLERCLLDTQSPLP